MASLLSDAGDIVGINKESLQGSGEFAIWALVFGGLFILLIFLLVFIVKMLQYKHIVVLKNKTSGVPVARVCKARIIYEKSGLEKTWRLLKPNVEIPIPPDYAREQTNKGAFFVKAFIESDKGILFVVANSKKSTVKEDDISYEDLDAETIQKTDELFTTNSRIFYANQIRQADVEKGKTMLDIIEKAVFPILVIVLVMIVLIFLPRVFESFNSNVMEPMHEMMDDVHQYTQEVQSLRGDIQSICSQQQPQQIRPD